jgi:hypothetical protein
VIAPTTLARHHGSVKAANVDAYLHTLRANDITGVTAWNPMREPAATAAPPPD